MYERPTMNTAIKAAMPMRIRIDTYSSTNHSSRYAKLNGCDDFLILPIVKKNASKKIGSDPLSKLPVIFPAWYHGHGVPQ
jgi:hypothetical protein